MKREITIRHKLNCSFNTNLETVLKDPFFSDFWAFDQINELQTNTLGIEKAKSELETTESDEVSPRCFDLLHSADLVGGMAERREPVVTISTATSAAFDNGPILSDFRLSSSIELRSL